MGRRGVFVPWPGAPALARIPLLALTGPHLEPGQVEPLVGEGMFLASRQAGTIVTGTPTEAPTGTPQDALDGRAAATVRSYTLRANTRPTPHGVFAGVCLARFDNAPDADDGLRLSMGGAHRAHSAPHPGWLAEVADLVLDDPGVLPLLTLFTNTLAVRRGGRWEHERSAQPGAGGVRRVTMRATDATTLIMQVCRQGARWKVVLDAFAQRWPTAPEHAVSGLVVELVRCGFLLTDLLPSESGDPLGHLARRLPPGHALLTDLAGLREDLADADRFPPGAAPRLAALRRALAAADGIIVPPQASHQRQAFPLRVDVAADAQLTLPGSLAQQAADAAGVLWRINPAPDPLAGYHQRFLARYGAGRFVQLLEVIDPVTGIGPDPGEALAEGVRATRILADLIIEAVRGGRVEAELDAATVEAMAAAAKTASATPPRTAEIQVRVIADSPHEAAAGRLRLAVCPGANTQDAGSSAGRFASLLPGMHTDHRADDGAMVAELAVRGRTASGATLAVPAGFAGHRIPLGVPVRPGDLDLEDLLLASDGHQLRLWSQRLGQPVIPILYSRLASPLLPPAAPLLRAMSDHGTRPWQTWSWGPLARTPFQPRVRYRTTILTPARWRLPSALTRAARDASGWDAAVARWRATTAPPSPPDIVVIQMHDRALPVDLDRAEDRELLRRHVYRGGTWVTEQPGGPDATQAVVTGLDGSHVLELIVPLARACPAPAHTRPQPPPERVRRTGEGLHLPGGDWLSLTIRTPATCQDDVITRIGDLADGFTAPWFWLRYCDHAGPHLRVRFHGDPVVLGGQLLPGIATLVTDLIANRLASGFSVEPYEQETERYGGSPETMQAAEKVFAADSRLVLALLAKAPDPGRRIIMAALSAAAIARTVAGSDDDAFAALAGRHLDRDTRREFSALRPRTRAAVTPAGPLWALRDTALSAYRTTLPLARTVSAASSLIHMHTNRIIGQDHAEPLVRALAADLLYLTSANPVSTDPASAEPAQVT